MKKFTIELLYISSGCPMFLALCHSKQSFVNKIIIPVNYLAWPIKDRQVSYLLIWNYLWLCFSLSSIARWENVCGNVQWPTFITISTAFYYGQVPCFVLFCFK